LDIRPTKIHYLYFMYDNTAVYGEDNTAVCVENNKAAGREENKVDGKEENKEDNDAHTMVNDEIDCIHAEVQGK